MLVRSIALKARPTVFLAKSTSARKASSFCIFSMSGDKSGLSVKEMPDGPDMDAKKETQVQGGDLKEAQPGLQNIMPTQPETTRLPTAVGNDQLELREYVGAGKLRNKVAIITGGDSGIGRSVAVMYAREGADVAIVYLPKEQQDAEETQKLVEEAKQQCLLLPLDISEEKNLDEIVNKTLEKFGKVDILVNNAALQVPGSVEEATYDLLDQHFRTNLYPMFGLTARLKKHMIRGAVIINTTSVTAYRGSPSLLQYSATKGAIVAFTRSLAQELIQDGIRVNAVAPGPAHTPLNPAGRDADMLEKWLNKVPPVGHMAHPSEIGPSYVFLASGEATQYNGQVLHPNGGDVLNT